MSTKGAKSAFTEEEKLTFKPIFVKYLKKEYGSEDILAALSGDEAQFARFTYYANELKAFMAQRQTTSKMNELEQSKVLLTNSIKQRKSAIKQSREVTMEAIMTKRALIY